LPKFCQNEDTAAVIHGAIKQTDFSHHMFQGHVHGSYLHVQEKQACYRQKML